MANAIVHIGFNKCGSTAIQKWLADNSDALQQQGFGHRHTDPRPNAICSNPQFSVLAHTRANAIMPSNPIQKILEIESGDRTTQDAAAAKFERSYLDWLGKTDFPTYLISSEYLGAGLSTPTLVAALDLWTRHHIGRTRYVAYIRRPDAWLISAHGHEVRNRETFENLKEFAARLSPVPYIKSLQIWLKAIGTERLEVRLFQEPWLRGKGLTEDFSAFIGADVSKIPNPAKLVNRSYSDSKIVQFRTKSIRPAPKRPTFDAQTRQHVDRANADGMSWIQQTFFQGQEDRFRSWLDPETIA